MNEGSSTIMTESNIENRIATAERSYRLDLSGMGIAEIPAGIWNLDHLEEIDLSFNSLSNLPDLFDRFPHLSVLNLGDNQITELPPSISSCTKLQIIQAERNQLSDLPNEFVKNARWKVFGLSGNKFKKLPKWLSKLDFVNLLAVDRNEIERISVKELPNFLLNLTLKGNPVFDNCPEDVLPYLTLKDIPFGANPQIEFPPKPGKLIQFEGTDGLRIVLDFIGIRTYSGMDQIFRSIWGEVFGVSLADERLDLTTSRTGYIDQIMLGGYNGEEILRIEKEIRTYWQGFRLYRIYDINWSDESLGWNE